MPTKIAAWKSVDGQLFEHEQAAKDHEFEVAFRAWAADVAQDTAFPRTFEALVEQVVIDRMNLLSLFKLLNGGIALTAPPDQNPPDCLVDSKVIRMPEPAGRPLIKG